MDGERVDRFVLSRRVVWVGVLAGFLVDALGHAWDVFRAGLPVTLGNIYQHGTRAGHAEAWLVSGALCLAFGAYVVGQAVGTILENREVRS